MNYDLHYYGAHDLLSPMQPTKPQLGRNPSSHDARAFADDLEAYERDLENYKDDLTYYREQKTARLNELKNRLRDDYDISDAQRDVLWRQAWEDGHSESLQRVVDLFESLYEMAAEFAALEKNQNS